MKKVFKYYLLTLVVLIVSCVYVSLNKNLTKVYANEMQQTVNLEVTSASGFEKGTVEGYGKYPVGSTVTLTAIPADGCYFEGWRVASGEIVTANPYSFVIELDTQIEPLFEFSKYEVAEDFDYFTLTDVSYAYDMDRFDDDHELTYPRASIDTIKTTGYFYYNDIVTLKYKMNNNDSIVKELTSSSFSMNKTVKVVSVDTEDKILWVETNGVKNYELAGTKFMNDSYEYDYSAYEYVIATNISIGTNKYITTAFTIKSKITKNLEIFLTENNLKLITMSAKLVEDGAESDLDMILVEDTISIDYAFYGRLTDISVITDGQTKNRYYLVEHNSNYQLTLSDNNDYEYIRTNLTTDEIVTGYFDSAISGFTFYYQKRGYEIAFEQIVKTAEGYSEIDTNYIEIESFNGLRGDVIKVDYSDKKIYINEVEKFAFGFVADVYGFDFFGFSTTNELDEANTSIEYTIDDANPSGVTIYIILTKIVYNIEYGLADISEEYNEYFTSRASGFSELTTCSRLDKINLTVILPYGFKTIKWIMKNGTQVVELAQTNFNFTPKSNDSNVQFLCVVDYNYSDFTLQLNGFDEENANENVANTEVIVLQHFAISADESMLQIYVKAYSHSQSRDLCFVVFGPLLDVNKITFTSELGTAIIEKTEDLNSYKSLTFNFPTAFNLATTKSTVVFTYSEADGQFRRYSSKADSRTAITCATVSSVEDYSIKLYNICVDDIIYSTANLKTAYNTKYQFANFSSGVDSTISYTTYTNIDSLECVVIGNSYSDDVHIIVKYIKSNGHLFVYSKNSNAFKFTESNIGESIDINSGTVQVDNDGLCDIAVTIEVTLQIKIKKSSIAKGYEFVGFGLPDVDNQESIFTKVEDNIYHILEFKFYTDLANKYIDVDFKEIEYVVTIDSDAEVNVYNHDNVSILDTTTNSFKISWGTINNNTTSLKVTSSVGHYVKMSYLKDENNLINIMGTQTSQTDMTFNIDKNNNKTVFESITELADRGAITLFIVEEERLFNITIQYTNDRVDNSYLTDAKVKCEYTKDGEKVFESKNATSRQGQNSTIYCLDFTGIKFGTKLTLTMDDSAIEGAYFSCWNYNTDIASTEWVFDIDSKDMYIYAKFIAIEYKLSFVYLDGNRTESKDITDGGTFTVNGLSSNYFYIGDSIQMNITEKTGYSFVDAYYYPGVMKNFYDENIFTYDINEFIPSIYLEYSRDAQKNDTEKQILCVYLVFSEKYYTISATVENNTYKNNKNVNTISTSLEDWINKETLTLEYFTGGEYVIKKDGIFKTNDRIKIKFNTAIIGITLETIELGGENFKLKTIGLSNVAGQEISWSKETIDNLDHFTLIFNLSSTLLSTCGNSSKFNLTLGYTINTYNVTLTTNVINEKLLISAYGLTITYTPIRNLNYSQAVNIAIFGSESSSTGNTFTKNDMFYGAESTWTISYNEEYAESSGYQLDFDDKYIFSYFEYKKSDGSKVRFNIGEEGHTHKIGPQNTYLDQYKNEFLLWDLIAADANESPVITAFYEPNITLNPDLFDEISEDVYKKTVIYNSIDQRLKTSKDKENDPNIVPDIIYPSDEFKTISIRYYVLNTETQNMQEIIDVKNANVYRVIIEADGIECSKEVYLQIDKRKLTINYMSAVVVGTITKEYDGKSELTEDNINNLKQSQFTFGKNELCESDKGYGQLNLTGITGYYVIPEGVSVGTDFNVIIDQIRLSANLSINYYIKGDSGDPNSNVEQVLSIDLGPIGSITPRKLEINPNLFTFDNIVYKEGVEYSLKYTQNAEELTFTKPLVEGDECKIDASKINPTLTEYSIGKNRPVKINLSECLTGADRANYYIDDIYYNINIHPYEIVYEIEHVGKWTITDFDEGCCIPLDIKIDSLTVEIINSSSERYSEFYSIVEDIVGRNEKLFAFYDFKLKTTKGNTVGINKCVGAYITFTDVKGLSSLYDVGNDINKLNINRIDDRVAIKIGEDTSNIIAVLANKSYFTIKRILLIVGIVLLALLIIIICIIIFKKLRARKHKDREKIY